MANFNDTYLHQRLIVVTVASRRKYSTSSYDKAYAYYAWRNSYKHVWKSYGLPQKETSNLESSEESLEKSEGLF